MPPKDNKPDEPVTPAAPSEEEIVGSAEAAEQVAIIDDPEFVLPDDFDPAAVPDVEESRKLAKIPAHKRASDLIDRELVFLQKRPQRAVLPGTGEITHGQFCVVMDPKTREVMTVFIGQQVLQRDLAKLTLPFRAKITKTGRSYKFI